MFLIGLPALSAFGLLNNLAFLYTIIRVRRLRTSLNAYLASLSVSDCCFLICITCMYVPLYQRSIWRLDLPVSSPLGCALYDMIAYFWYYASFGLLTLISWERYLAIAKPMRHLKAKSRGKSRTVQMIVCAWIAGLVLLLVNTPFYTVTGNKFCLLWPTEEKYKSKPTSFHVCRSNSPPYAPGKEESLLIYSELTFTVIFAIIFVFNMTLYVFIIKAIRRATRRLKRELSITSSKTPNHIRKQLTITLIVNGIIFFLCQVPARYNSLHILVSHFTNGNVSIWPDTGFSEYTLGGIAAAGLVFNSAINPWVYVIGSSYYRQAFKEAFGFCCCNNTKWVSFQRRKSLSEDFLIGGPRTPYPVNSETESTVL